MNERPIPEAARRDGNAVEMARVWIAEGQLHCSMKVGMYEETTSTPEGSAWGTILADMARHVAMAMAAGYSADQDEVIEEIRAAFLDELNSPSSDAEGDFSSQVDPT